MTSNVNMAQVHCLLHFR